MEELRSKYADRDVEFVVMYVREPHAGERGFRGYRNPATIEEKADHARELIATKRLHMPVVVDGMDETYHRQLGNLPNMAYVVDRDGRVRLASTWSLADDVDRVLADLVTTDDPTRPVHPSIDTRGLGPAI